MKEIKIYGAGLSGLVAGISLAREGYRVIIIDREDNIGGSKSYHPSVHTTPVQMRELIDYLAIDVTENFILCDPYPSFYDKARKITLPQYVEHNKAYCVERGSRETSIDQSLYKEAIASGVEFEFGNSGITIPLKKNSILATGLDPQLYRDLNIPHRLIYGCWSLKETGTDESTGDIFMGPFSTDYGYIARVNGISYNLLFSRRPISKGDLDGYKETLEKLGIEPYPEPWRPALSAIPDKASLFNNDIILAGTLSGMIEPFWGYGIVGALISGRLAARAVQSREKAHSDFMDFTSGYAKKLEKRERFSSYPYFIRAFLMSLSVIFMRIQCSVNKQMASKAREPLRWFRKDSWTL